MAKVLESIGSSSGQALTKHLDALVRHHCYFIITSYLRVHLAGLV